MKRKPLIYSILAVLLIVCSYVGYRYYINHKVKELCRHGLWDDAIKLDPDCYCGYHGRAQEREQRWDWCGACEDWRKAGYLGGVYYGETACMRCGR